MFAARANTRPDLDQMVIESAPMGIRIRLCELRVHAYCHRVSGADPVLLRYGQAESHRSLSMSETDLRNLLTQLHARLGGAPSLTAEDKRLLGAVLGDIEKALGKNPVAPTTDSSRLESLAVKFEGDHPALAETLRRLVDALVKAGI
jgi:hypothetical protein